MARYPHDSDCDSVHSDTPREMLSSYWEQLTWDFDKDDAECGIQFRLKYSISRSFGNDAGIRFIRKRRQWINQRHLPTDDVLRAEWSYILYGPARSSRLRAKHDFGLGDATKSTTVPSAIFSAEDFPALGEKDGVVGSHVPAPAAAVTAAAAIPAPTAVTAASIRGKYSAVVRTAQPLRTRPAHRPSAPSLRIRETPALDTASHKDFPSLSK